MKRTKNRKHTYLLTQWYRVLLEKLTGLQLVKKFPAFRGNRRFITALTNVRHLSLSWASPIQSIYPHPTSWRSIRKNTLQPRIFIQKNKAKTTKHKIQRHANFFPAVVIGDCLHRQKQVMIFA